VLFQRTVNLRGIALAMATALVLGMGVYLFFEVRAKPAAAQASGARTTPPERDRTAPVEPPTTPRAVESSKPPRSPDDRKPSTGRVEVKPDPEDLPAGDPEDIKPSYKLDFVMAEANKAYDRQDFDEARTIAQKVLKKLPGNARMLRIMVSAACVESDGPEAQKHYDLLPAGDRAQMRTRCTKYGVTFTDPPAVMNPPK